MDCFQCSRGTTLLFCVLGAILLAYFVFIFWLVIRGA